MKRPLCTAILLLVLGVCGARPASAVPPPDGAGQEASRHFERGVKLAEEEDWPAALIEFSRAYAIDPNYRVLYDIGQCQYQLHQYPGALAAFQRYLAEGRDLVAPDRRARVEADIDLLRGRVAELQVSSRIAGAEVSVDDVVVGTTPLMAPIVVSAGRRKVAVSKAGAAATVRYVELAGEEHVNVAIDPVFSAEAPLPRTESTPTRSSAQVPAWIAFGVGAAGSGVGAYFGVAAMTDKTNLDRQCVAKSCPPSSQTLIATSQRDSLLSTIGFGVGIAGVVSGIGCLVFMGGERAPTAGIRLGAMVGPRSVGAAGTF